MKNGISLFSCKRHEHDPFYRVLLIIGPDPIAYLWHILKVGSHIRLMFGKQIFTLSYEGCCELTHTMCSVRRLNTQVIAAHAIAYHHIEWCGRGAFLNISAHMEARR